jgi:hypothetical protein
VARAGEGLGAYAAEGAGSAGNEDDLLRHNEILS